MYIVKGDFSILFNLDPIFHVFVQENCSQLPGNGLQCNQVAQLHND